MTRARTPGVMLAAIVVVAACTDAPTEPPPSEVEASLDALAFVFPANVPNRVVVQGLQEGPGFTGSGGPARVTEESEEPPPTWEELDPSNLPPPGIWNARTTAGFQPGAAWAEGSHNYQANKASIETILKVSLDGREIASQRGFRVEDSIFWFDPGLPKRIWLAVLAYVEQECGLAAYGTSEHAAWWEAVPGASIASFGRQVDFSESALARQPECEPDPPPPSGGMGGGSGGYCYVETWFYEDTGEIIDQRVLYCEQIGG